MVRYNGRNKLLTSAVNGNQIGLKMGGAAPSVGRAISTRRHTKRRVRDNLKFCGPVYYRGQLWNFNADKNCVVRAPITQASAGGVGHINHPRKKCNSNCSLGKCNIADSIKLVRQYFINQYGEDGIALVAPAETLASDGINEHINGPILHFDPNHSPYYTLPQNIREAVDCINALELKYRLKDSPDKKRHIVGHLPQDTQQALRQAYFGNFMKTFGSETIYAFGSGVNTADLKKIVKEYLDARNDYLQSQYPTTPTAHAVEAYMAVANKLWNKGGYAHIGDIPTGPVTDMSNLFSSENYWYDVSTFNQPLNKWDTSGVTNMSNMFYGATVFDQPLNTKVFNQGTSNEYTAWDTSSVTNMSYMFYGASAFKGDISKWNTSNVTDMSYMFYNASAFNQPLNKWDTSRVKNMSNMFYGATVFDQPLNTKVFYQGTPIAYTTWDTSSVTNMSYMFYGASAFKGDISKWNTSNVTDMSYMFYNASAFNQPLNKWDTSRVKNMSNMFYGATVFNQPLSTKEFNQGTSNVYIAWDTSSVTNMSYMFYGATAFNEGMDWSVDTRNVTDMSYMFYGATAFNGGVNWSVDTRNVTDMSYMFYGATKFNQNIAQWDTSKVTNMSHMFYEATDFYCNTTTYGAGMEGGLGGNPGWNIGKVTDWTCFTKNGSKLVTQGYLPLFQNSSGQQPEDAICN